MSIYEKTEICHFVHIIIRNILLSQGYGFCPRKNYTALLTEFFHMSVTYLKSHTPQTQIANQPSPH